jgi:hypothetical protein
MTADEKIAIQCTTAYNCASDAYGELIASGRRSDADELLAAIRILQGIGNQAIARLRSTAATPHSP